MRKRVVAGAVGVVMLLVAVGFVLYALNHPEASFPWYNNITYTLYGIYVIITVLMFFIAFRKKSRIAG